MQKIDVLIDANEKATDEGYQAIVFNGGTQPLTITIRPGRGLFVKVVEDVPNITQDFSITTGREDLFA